MKKLLLVFAFLPLSAPAAPPPCYWGIPASAWEAQFLEVGKTGDVFWAGWTCYPKNINTLDKPQVVFLAGTGSLGTFGTRLQTARLDPTKADGLWNTYVKLNAAVAYPAAYAEFKARYGIK